MVDRIEKLKPHHYQIEEANEEREGRGRGQEQERKKKKEKDKFDRGASVKPFWKKLVPESMTKSLSGRSIWGNADKILASSGRSYRGETEPEEVSLSLSRRVLFLWGVVDTEGRPRVPVIVTYAALVIVIASAIFLILGVLWR